MKKIGIIILMLALFIGGAVFFPVPMPHVQLPAEKIGEVAGVPITNTMLAAWATTAVLSLLFLSATRNMKLVPGRLQGFAEGIIEILLGLCEAVAGKEKGRQYFPLVATFFLFIVVSNWMGLLPGYTTIGVWHEVEAAHAVEAPADGDVHDAAAAETAEEGHTVLFPLFRSANTDLNTTLALALVSVVATQIYGIKSLGFKGYTGKFISFKSPIDFAVGLLEAIGEFAKIVSFSFRLFGNIFAGEVLLGVMVFLVPWVALVPFMGLELFVGVIQAFIFFMLTLVFLSVATADHSGGHGSEHGAEHSHSH